jgi:hypothetical protein
MACRGKKALYNSAAITLVRFEPSVRAERMSAGPICLTAVVRQVLHEHGNKPLRLPRVWELVSARQPDLAKSKTHFKRCIVDQMVARGEIVKDHVMEEVKGKGERRFYAMRLKNNAANKVIDSPKDRSSAISAQLS